MRTGGVVPQRWVTRAAIAATLAVAVAAPVQGASARHLQIDIDETFINEFLTDACGTLVVNSIEASLNVTLQYNRDGLIVREVDPSGGGTVTISAPATGNAISTPFNSTVIDYGSGAALGSSFTMRLAGIAGHVPGFIEADAGMLRLAGTVTGFDENGSPVLEVTEFLGFNGHAAEGDRIVAAICGALGA